MNRRSILGLVVLASCATNPEANTGTTGGSEPVFHDVGAGPRSIAVADFNGDQRPDVAVANGGAGTVSVLLAEASGRLASAKTFPAGPEPSDVDAADLDGDGRADLVLVNHETSRLTVLRNTGAGSFVPVAGSPFETGAQPHSHGVATADFDGDGRLDLATESADSKTVIVMRGIPSGFAAPVSVSVATMPYYRLGVGNISGAATILVPGHGDNTVRLIERSGTGLALSALSIALAGKPWMVVGGDVNGDGRDDVVVVETDAVSIWLRTASGFTQAPGSPIALAGATEVAVGHLDGDGSAEIAIGPWTGSDVTIRSGKTGALSTVRVCERPIGLAIADLDGDGRGELLATCTMTATLAIVKVG